MCLVILAQVKIGTLQVSGCWRGCRCAIEYKSRFKFRLLRLKGACIHDPMQPVINTMPRRGFLETYDQSGGRLSGRFVYAHHIENRAEFGYPGRGKSYLSYIWVHIEVPDGPRRPVLLWTV
jgi:hypothetical protein